MQALTTFCGLLDRRHLERMLEIPHSLHHSTHGAAGDDAGAFRGGLQEHGAGAEDAGHFVGDGGAVQGDLHHVLLGVGDALEDGLGHFRSLAQA